MPISLSNAGWLATVTALMIVSCSDSATGPRADVPPAGVYVLQSVNGIPLPWGSISSGQTQAETLFVASDRSYFVAGLYATRGVGAYNVVKPPRTFQIAGDSVIAPELGASTPALLVHRGDTVLAHSSDGSATGVYVRVPTPAPPGPVASLVLKTSDTLLLMGGGPVDVQTLVHRGVDANGLWMTRPVPTVSFTPPPGWTANGSSVTPPADVESEATITLSSGQATTPLTLRSVLDLRRSKWRISWFCGGGLRKYPFYQPSTYRDSLSVSGAVDSIVYRRGDVSPSLDVVNPYRPPFDATVWFRPTIVQYLSSGEVQTSLPAAVGSMSVAIGRQAPDSIIYNPDHVIYGQHPLTESIAVASQSSPCVYTGGNLCSTDLYSSYRPAVLAQVP